MEGRKCVDDIERVILMVASKLQLNCSGLLSTRPDISSPRTAFVAYPGSGSTYIRWTCDFLLFEIDFLNVSLQKGYDVVWWSFTTTTQHHSDFRISRSSLLLQTDMIFVLFLHWQGQISALQTDAGTGLWQDHCDGGGWRWLVFSFCIFTNFVYKSLYRFYLVSYLD